MEKATFEKILAMGNGFEHIESISPTSGKIIYTESYDIAYHSTDGVIECRAKHDANPAQHSLTYLMEVAQVEYVRLYTDKVAVPFA